MGELDIPVKRNHKAKKENKNSEYPGDGKNDNILVKTTILLEARDKQRCASVSRCKRLFKKKIPVSILSLRYFFYFINKKKDYREQSLA